MSKIVLVSLIGELGYGGSERQLYLTQKGLDPDLFDRHVVVFNPSNYDVYNSALAERGVKIWPMPSTAHRPHQRMWFIFKLLRQLKADIVHSWTVHDNPYAGIAGRLARVPVRWGSLRGSLHSPGFQQLPPAYRYLALHAVSKIVVNAHSLAAQLTQKNYQKEKIIYLPNAVIDLAKGGIADLAQYDISPEQTVVGIVGNLRSVKNHKLFVQAMADIQPQFPHLIGVIVGQEIKSELSARDELVALIMELGLEKKVHWIGFRNDVPDLLRRFDLFCLTSDSEGMSNAVLEAMSAQCPVVVTRVGAMQDFIIDGENGYLITPGDHLALAEKIGCLLHKPHAQQIAQAGYKTVRDKFSYQIVADHLSQSYLDALKK